MQYRCNVFVRRFGLLRDQASEVFQDALGYSRAPSIAEMRPCLAAAAPGSIFVTSQQILLQIRPSATSFPNRALTRVCQPGPLPRRCSTVLASSRIFTSTFGESNLERPRRDGFIPAIKAASSGGYSSSIFGSIWSELCNNPNVQPLVGRGPVKPLQRCAFRHGDQRLPTWQPKYQSQTDQSCRASNQRYEAG